MLQMVDRKLKQIIVCHICIKEMVKVFTKPCSQLRKFFQMSGMKPAVRILGFVAEGICKIFIQIASLHEAVGCLQFHFCQKKLADLLIDISCNL